MEQFKMGLVLEGGGMRGLYTIGVLDYLMEQQFQADYVIGVSAGACNGASYVSGQMGRSYRINTAYLADPRYVSLRNYLNFGSVFGMDFLFDQIPHHLDPYDYDKMLASPCQFWVGVTDVIKGQPVYFGKGDMDHHSQVLRASSAIPVFSTIVEYKGGKYLDGGTSDPIPVKKAIRDGCQKLLVVLTRPRGYVKAPEPYPWIYERVFRQYPQMIALLARRHKIYNNALEYVDYLEQQGQAVVIAPSGSLGISRFEKNRSRLEKLYQMGRKDGATADAKLRI